MSTSKVSCAICREFFKPNDLVDSNKTCGHLFHRNCLTRCLQRNLICPLCKRTCNKHLVYRVHLSFGEKTEEDEIPVPSSTEQKWIPLTIVHGEKLAEPKDGIQVGTDDKGNKTYVARAKFYEDLLPANYVPERGGAYASCNKNAHFLHEDVELLVDFNCQWVADRDGCVPADAVVTGYTHEGENLYTGRGVYEGFTLLGKVHPSHGVLYMPFKGKEVNVKEYEVLVSAPKAQDAPK